MRLSSPLMTIATLPSLLMSGSQKRLFAAGVAEASDSTIWSSCSIGAASVG
jgi:hypothetical protein